MIQSHFICTFSLINLLCFITSVNSHKQPLVLWWTGLLFPHINKTTQIKCPAGNCISTKDRKHKSKDSTFTAMMFYGNDFLPDDLPLPKQHDHLWVLLHEESPMNNYIFSHQIGIQLFNYTATFSRESDFPLTTQFIPSLKYLTERQPVEISKKNRFREEGMAPILYLQSHCNVASDRDRYVKELMNFIDIDSYGKCLHNKNLFPDLVSTETYNDEKLLEFISKYKFHIAFENALCDDYITEKLFRPLHVGSVPIYRGSPTVKDWVPSEKSVIVVDDFESPKQLADFIFKLDKNDSLYSEYLQFKKPNGIANNFLKETLEQRIWGVNDINKIDFIQGFECYICDQLNLMSEVTSDKIKMANRKHMNCPQPHMSILSNSDIDIDDEWLLEDWVETFWFAYDQARATHLMIKNKEGNSSNFLHYVLQFKYQH